MNTRRLLWKLILPLTLFALLGGTLSCAGEVEPRPRAWIDFPLDDSKLPAGTPVPVISHAYAREGVADVLLSVNGETYQRNPPEQPGASFSKTVQEWQPEEAGSYVLQITAYDNAGETSNSATVRVRVIGRVALKPTNTPTLTSTPETPPSVTPTSCPTGSVLAHGRCVPLVTPTFTPSPTGTPKPPTPTFTPKPAALTTEAPPQPADIRFWPDDESVQAGSCTTVRWHVSNVQAYWVDGKPGAGDDGSFQTCPCQDEAHTLRVTRGDGSEQTLSVTIRVSGHCEAPPPPPEETEPPPPAKDTTPPPVPSPAVPKDKAELSCRSSQTLAWLPVSDPSSPVSYYVKLELQVKKGQWQSAGGWGPVSGKQVDVGVQCGGIYRWMVRAQDGAGNASDWSSWSYFSVSLE
jgi:hypothetical protein